MPIYQSEAQRVRIEDINDKLRGAEFLRIDFSGDGEFVVFKKDGKEFILSSHYFKGDGNWFVL